MTRRHKKQSAQRKARRLKSNGHRKRGGVASIILGPNDAACVFRGASGAVRFYNPRSTTAIQPGTGAFWNRILQWIFADNADAAELRKILTDDFMLDIQEHVAEQRKAAIMAEAERRLELELTADPVLLTDEKRASRIAAHVETVAAELEAAEAAEEEAEGEARVIAARKAGVKTFDDVLAEDEAAEEAAEASLLGSRELTDDERASRLGDECDEKRFAECPEELREDLPEATVDEIQERVDELTGASISDVLGELASEASEDNLAAAIAYKDAPEIPE